MITLLCLFVSAAPAHVLRVHVYSDVSDGRFVDQTNTIVADLSVRFSVQRRSTLEADPGLTLEQALTALERRDPGGEADVVIGVLPAAKGETLHEQSRARSPGRHLVVRAGPRAATAFLHAWAHTLGAVDASDPARITSPRASDAATFSRQDRQLIGIALAHFPALLTEPSKLVAYKHEATAYLRLHAKNAGFDDEALATTLEWLSVSNVTAAPLPEIAAQWLKEATEHTDNAKLQLGWNALKQIEALDAHPQVAMLWCRLSLLTQPPPSDLLDRCRRAVDRNPLDPMAFVLRANSELATRAPDAAAISLIRAATLLDRTANAPKVWEYFGSLARVAGCITYAEHAAASTGGETIARVTAWATLARRRAAIPAGMRGSDECRLQGALTPALDHLEGKRFAAAREVAKGNEAPALAIQCEAFTLESRDKDAEPICTRVLEAAPDSSVAHYCLGVIAFRRGEREVAAKRFARVLELDPDAGHARTMLARASSDR